jgi:hypothetical protein
MPTRPVESMRRRSLIPPVWNKSDPEAPEAVMAEGPFRVNVISAPLEAN